MRLFRFGRSSRESEAYEFRGARAEPREVTTRAPRAQGTTADQINGEDLELAAAAFDPASYRRQASAAGFAFQDDADDEALLAHYLTIGWRAGLDPSEEFSTRFYIETYRDVSECEMQPFLHYLRDGKGEGRVPRAATEDERDLAAKIVDPCYYRYRHRDLAGEDVDLLQHFATFGWREARDPNPFTHLKFVKRMSPEVFCDLPTVACHLGRSIFHNALMRRPASLKAIREALEHGDEALEKIFTFDVKTYSREQHDVLAVSPFHPVEHLFYDGLFQNRLRNGEHLHWILTPVESFVNDYELLVAQDTPLVAAGFHGLDLSVSRAEAQADLSSARVGVGVVLYNNSRTELERLVHSIRENLCGAPFGERFMIWDNSPEALDLSWIAEHCTGIELKIEAHQDNLGFARSHNGLMAACFGAGCTHYFGLNPDGYLLRGSIEAALRFALAKEHPALIELDCEPISHPKWYHPLTGETEWVSGAAFLLDAEAYQRTGGFDPDFPMYCEDADLSFRAMQAGVGLYVAPKARYYHDTSGRLHNPEAWRTGRMMVGTWYLCQKWGNPSRADLIKTEMLRQGLGELALPEPPKPVADVHPKIRELLKKERFACSRFWGS